MMLAAVLAIVNAFSVKPLIAFYDFKEGKNAEINVMNRGDNTEIHIKLFN